MDAEYAKWRDGEIKHAGLHTQLKAEAMIDKHEQQRKVRILDEEGGSVQHVSADNAAIAVGRGRATYSKDYYTTPGLPGAEKRYNLAPEGYFTKHEQEEEPQP